MNNDYKHYEDIIHLPRHRSKTRPPMSRLDRAAQFSPFAALAGHSELLEETARVTEDKAILTEDEKPGLTPGCSCSLKTLRRDGLCPSPISSPMTTSQGEST